jgi:hypothetical protein
VTALPLARLCLHLLSSFLKCHIIIYGICYLFIYSLFNDTFSSSAYIASNERMIVNNELERMWKETVVA